MSVDAPNLEILAARLARNVVATRGAAGLTQQQLARRARLSRATVALVESGDSDPRLSTVALLAQALGTDLIALLAEQEDRRTSNASLT